MSVQELWTARPGFITIYEGCPPDILDTVNTERCSIQGHHSNLLAALRMYVPRNMPHNGVFNSAYTESDMENSTTKPGKSGKGTTEDLRGKSRKIKLSAVEGDPI